MSKSTGFLAKIKNISFGSSKSYLFEYGLLLSLIVVVLNIVKMMYEDLINKAPEVSLGGPMTMYMPYGFTDVTNGLLATGIVILPILVILIQRTAQAERSNPQLLNGGWRTGLKNIFLFLVSLWGIVFFVMALSTLLNYFSVGTATDVSLDWRDLTGNLLASILAICTVWAFSNETRSSNTAKRFNIVHVYRYGIVLVSVALIILFAIFSYWGKRGEAVDNLISTDLYSIDSKINNKANDTKEVPTKLDDIELSKEEKKRATKYNYKYEKLSDAKYKICANFSTDSKANASGGGFAFPMYYSENDFYNHGVGEKCFEKEIYMYDPKAVGGLEGAIDSLKTPDVTNDSMSTGDMMMPEGFTFPEGMDMQSYGL
jgi:hypothetical protein